MVPTAAGCHNLVERGRRVPGLPAVAALPDLHRLAVRRDQRPELQTKHHCGMFKAQIAANYYFGQSYTTNWGLDKRAERLIDPVV